MTPISKCPVASANALALVGDGELGSGLDFALQAAYRLLESIGLGVRIQHQASVQPGLSCQAHQGKGIHIARPSRPRGMAQVCSPGHKIAGSDQGIQGCLARCPGPALPTAAPGCSGGCGGGWCNAGWPVCPSVAGSGHMGPTRDGGQETLSNVVMNLVASSGILMLLPERPTPPGCDPLLSPWERP